MPGAGAVAPGAGAGAPPGAGAVAVGAVKPGVVGDGEVGGVLADAGVQRPAAQRGASFDVAAGRYQEQVEGDLIYVILAGEQGKEYGESVMRGREWKDLGAVSDHRVFAVEDSVWHGGGLTAARALLTDLRNTLNGFVTD